MSNPVTNAEVEDVLSSIRRLVSEDKRPSQNAKKSPPNDRLVLTPALRVTPEHPTPEVDAPDAAPFVLNGATFADAEERESAAPDVPVFEDSTPDDPAEDYSADPYGFAEHEAETPSPARAEKPEPAVKTRGAAGASVFRHVASALQGEADESRQGRRDGFQTPPQSAEPRDRAKPSALSDKIAALETAIGKISDRWEPDQAGTDDYSGTEAPAMAWEDDDLHRDGTGAPVDAGGQETPPLFDTEPTPPPVEDNLDYSADDQLIDEEALRDLVSEIVREELQGALGERITRNVRKLVRREIHRALAAQELE